jgi:hypothetical protein
MLFRFKICFTNPSVTYDVPEHWTLEYTFARLRDYLCEDFQIHNTFHIVPGPLLQNIGYMDIAERHPPFDMRGDEQRLLSNYFNFGNSVQMFYIRPMDEPEGTIEYVEDIQN